MLWVRSLETLAPRVLEGSDGAQNPFWTADSRSVLFFVGDQIKAVQLSGGSPSVLLQRDDHHRSQLHCIHDLLLLRLCPRQGAMSLSVSVSCVTIGVLTICVSNVVRDIHEIINASGKAPNF
jgi:hypothetical protein